MEQQDLTNQPNQQQHEDIKLLLRSVMPVAEKALTKKGSFSPLGAALFMDNNVRAIPCCEDGEEITAEIAVARYRRMFRNLAVNGRIRAAVIMCNEYIEKSPTIENSDAVCAELDHVDGYSADYLFPYKKTPDGLAFGQTFGVQTENRLRILPEASEPT